MLEVLTFRDRSLLSTFAHDLCLAAHPDVSVDGARVVVRCAVATLTVRGKVLNGVVAPLLERDRSEIEATLRRDVLRVATHPEVCFEGELVAGAARGALRLNGRTVPLEIPVRMTDGRARGEVELVPSRWGVAPYTAMFGALKIQDRVRVRFDVALP